MREAIAKRQHLPASQTKCYFCFSFTDTTGKKPKLTVVATTRHLQARWVNMPQCPAAVDGGFKFNLLGWPIHAIGKVNEAGQYGLCALGMTSTMEGSQVTEMLQGFRDSTARVIRGNPNKKFAMSDAELAYRRALSEVFRSDNLMCFFHVKQAARDYIMAHCH